MGRKAPTASRADALGFLEAARDAALESGADGVRILGPATASMERKAGRYRAQLLLESRQRGPLQRLFDAWLPRI